jgi:Holliday junction resolvase-like predicted endonuclease
MSSTERGKRAEQVAGEYLQTLGYKVLEYNWRTRYCEIDVVAQNNESIVFVEVKYRQSSRQGHGLEYITPQKLKQMARAADMWVSYHYWPGEYCLGAIEVSGDEYSVDAFIDQL